ncbi:hypothetical protein [Paraburkholderia hayleyella]|uniref:hypothetical protein n=1 Tax=Paraburkholderia hayleyella TaxID=2152889 RepID=UPI0012926DBD|nr:hypothetical protein [Paraburkholderia hayleyella]
MSNIHGLTPINSTTPNIISDSDQNSLQNQNDKKSIEKPSESRRGSVEITPTGIKNPVVADTDNQEKKVNKSDEDKSDKDNIEINNIPPINEENEISQLPLSILQPESDSDLEKKISPLSSSDDKINISSTSKDIDDFTAKLEDKFNKCFYTKNSISRSDIIELVNTSYAQKFLGNSKSAEPMSADKIPAYKLVQSFLKIYKDLDDVYNLLEINQDLHKAKDDLESNCSQTNQNEERVNQLSAKLRRLKYQEATAPASENKKYEALISQETAQLDKEQNDLAKLLETYKEIVSKTKELTKKKAATTGTIQHVTTRSAKTEAYSNYDIINSGHAAIAIYDAKFLAILGDKIYKMATDPMMKNYCRFSKPKWFYEVPLTLQRLDPNLLSPSNTSVKS